MTTPTPRPTSSTTSWPEPGLGVQVLWHLGRGGSHQEIPSRRRRTADTGHATSRGERGFGEDDLGAVGSEGAPSVAGWCSVVAFDAEAVVDLGVVAFAEQAGVLQ